MKKLKELLATKKVKSPIVKEPRNRLIETDVTKPRRPGVKSVKRIIETIESNQGTSKPKEEKRGEEEKSGEEKGEKEIQRRKPKTNNASKATKGSKRKVGAQSLQAPKKLASPARLPVVCAGEARRGNARRPRANTKRVESASWSKTMRRSG